MIVLLALFSSEFDVAANYVMFLGLPWTPGLQDQAEDRAYRNGQLRMVVVKIYERWEDSNT